MAVTEPISKVNLERLTNGIYAFTMTLMIRNLPTPPSGASLDGAALLEFVDKTFFGVVDFIGAFLILGMFWLFYFQMFHRMKTFDNRFLYLHLLSLMVVVFVPFTQAFTSVSSQVPIADILFQFNYLALSVLLVLAWFYASHFRPSLLVPELTSEEARFMLKKFLVPLGVSLLGIILLFTGLPYADILYLLPFIILAVFFRHPPVVPETTD